MNDKYTVPKTMIDEYKKNNPLALKEKDYSIQVNGGPFRRKPLLNENGMFRMSKVRD